MFSGSKIQVFGQVEAPKLVTKCKMVIYIIYNNNEIEIYKIEPFAAIFPRKSDFTTRVVKQFLAITRLIFVQFWVKLTKLRNYNSF